MSLPERLAGEIERLFTTLASRRGDVAGDDAPALTARQRLALLTVVDEGPIRLGQLAERLRASDPTTTRTVDALERLGLVERVPDVADRRATRVNATVEGRRRVGRRRELLIELVHEPLEGLGARQQQRFVDLLAELNDLLAGPALERTRDPGDSQVLDRGSK
jgi:DNA-binding MarR family transcriptional regulator